MNLPSILHLEITSRCNSDCVMCLKHKSGMLKEGDMDFGLIKNIIDECEWITEIRPQFFGEPLLHPQFIDIIKYIKSKNKRILFYTNGSLLTPYKTLELLDVGTDRIIFSIDADNKELYEKIRRGLDFDVVMKNLKYFWEQSRRLKTCGEVSIALTRCPENKDRIQEIERFLSQYCDKVYVMLEKDLGIANRKVEKIRYNSNFECIYIKDMINIRWDGNVMLCCTDILNKYILGNVFKEDVAGIWNKPEYVELREKISNKQWLDICQVCLWN